MRPHEYRSTTVHVCRTSERSTAARRASERASVSRAKAAGGGGLIIDRNKRERGRASAERRRPATSRHDRRPIGPSLFKPGFAPFGNAIARPRDKMSVDALSDSELRTKLMEYGYPVGPVTQTTRKILAKKLKNLMEARASGGGGAGGSRHSLAAR